MRAMNTCMRGALMACAGAALALGGCLDDGAADPSGRQSAALNADASGGDASGQEDAGREEPGDPNDPGWSDAGCSSGGYGGWSDAGSSSDGYGGWSDAGSSSDGYGGWSDAGGSGGELHRCVVALVDCLFTEPEPLCEERFLVCFEGGGAEDPWVGGADVCDDELRQCLDAVSADGMDARPCFERFEQCMAQSEPPPPDPGDPAFFCDDELRACLDGQGPYDPTPCFERHQQCLAEYGSGGDPSDPGDPGDPRFCEEDLVACMSSGEPPDVCDGRFRTCLGSP